jgi:hypothetical protein
MPDLTTGPYSYVAANYRRAEQKFSNYGTRRLRFYTIEIDGYDIFEFENDTGEYDWNFGTTDSRNPGSHDDSNYGYKNQPKSIIEAILRGVALVAETYYVSWWRIEYDGNYPYLYITVAVAGDTFLDAQNQPAHGNPNSIGLVDSIAQALGDQYQWDNVYVWPAEINGDQLNEENDSYAVSREKVQISEAAKAGRTARLASPKITKVSRNG